MGSDLVKDKDKTQPIKANKDIRKVKNLVQRNQNHSIILKGILQDHNISLILILTGLRKSI